MAKQPFRIDVGIIAGNTSVNLFANSTTLVVSNTTSNVTVTPASVTVGTSSVNSSAITADSFSGNGFNLSSTRWNGAEYTISTGTPSGGADGNFWFMREA